MVPGAVAATVVVPPVSGSKAAPPVATLPGESMFPLAMVTVTEAPVIGVVTRVPTVGVLLVRVTVRSAAPLT